MKIIYNRYADTNREVRVMFLSTTGKDDMGTLYENIKSGQFFIDNLNDLLSPEGLQRWIVVALLLGGTVFLLNLLFGKGGKKKGIPKKVVMFLGCCLSVGMAHALFQILTGIPLKYF